MTRFLVQSRVSARNVHKCLLKTNIGRVSCLTVERNLFGEFSLVRTWGRLGTSSQQKIELHATEQDAQVAMMRKAQQKQRKGYA